VEVNKDHLIKLKKWIDDPVQFVRDVFNVEPDEWQIDALIAIAKNQRTAMKASKGVGKTAILAMACWWFLATRVDAKVAATSISWDNLADGLWAEMAKWQGKSKFLQENFVWTKTRISNKDNPENWFMSARTWSKSSSQDQQANTLAGLHADNIMFVLDESGGIPSAVMAAAEAALANDMEEHTDAKIIQAGNPTHLSGPLYEASVRDRKMWHVIEISSDPENPKRSPRVSIQWANEQIEKYGRDNPWVLVNVFGQFPPASLNALFGYEEVRLAMSRKVNKEDYIYSQKRIGVDVARSGEDATVLFPRQGLVAFKPVVMRGARNTEVASRVIAAKYKWNGEVEYVDGTGGFGGGVIDIMLQRGHSPQEIHFSSKATDPRYANKRAEMYFRAAEWVKRGGCLPKDDDLLRELPVIEYTFDSKGRLLIEPKEEIKSKLAGASPDKSDAFVLTFADEEQMTQIGELGLINRLEDQEYASNNVKKDWNPLDPDRN
jgi:phage terminase large subunit